MSYYILVDLAWFGIVWHLKKPPKRVLRNEQRLGSRLIKRTAEQLAARFNPENIDVAMKSSTCENELTVGDALSPSQEEDTRLPSMLIREQLRAEAKAMFPNTISLDDIVDRAYELLIESAGFSMLGLSPANPKR